MAPSTILTGASIFTPGWSTARPGAVAIDGERIMAVGTDAEILALRGP